MRGSGFFWAVELVRDADNGRFDADEREELLRRYLPGRLLEAGLIARADDRGDTVLQIAPPLICDDERARRAWWTGSARCSTTSRPTWASAPPRSPEPRQ